MHFSDIYPTNLQNINFLSWILKEELFVQLGYPMKTNNIFNTVLIKKKINKIAKLEHVNNDNW